MDASRRIQTQLNKIDDDSLQSLRCVSKKPYVGKPTLISVLHSARSDGFHGRMIQQCVIEGILIQQKALLAVSKL